MQNSVHLSLEGQTDGHEHVFSIHVFYDIWKVYFTGDWGTALS